MCQHVIGTGQVETAAEGFRQTCADAIDDYYVFHLLPLRSNKYFFEPAIVTESG